MCQSTRSPACASPAAPGALEAFREQVLYHMFKSHVQILLHYIIMP